MNRLRIIRLSTKYEKQNVIVRLLPNLDKGDPVTSFCIDPTSHPKTYRYYSYALFNNELCVFEYSALTHNYIYNKIVEEKVNVYDLKSNYALNIFVDLKMFAEKKFYTAQISDHRDDSNIVWDGQEETKKDILKRFEKDTTMDFLVKRLYRDRTPLNKLSEFFEYDRTRAKK